MLRQVLSSFGGARSSSKKNVIKEEDDSQSNNSSTNTSKSDSVALSSLRNTDETITNKAALQTLYKKRDDLEAQIEKLNSSSKKGIMALLGNVKLAVLTRLLENVKGQIIKLEKKLGIGDDDNNKTNPDPSPIEPSDDEATKLKQLQTIKAGLENAIKFIESQFTLSNDDKSKLQHLKAQLAAVNNEISNIQNKTTPTPTPTVPTDDEAAKLKQLQTIKASLEARIAEMESHDSATDEQVAELRKLKVELAAVNKVISDIQNKTTPTPTPPVPTDDEAAKLKQLQTIKVSLEARIAEMESHDSATDEQVAELKNLKAQLAAVNNEISNIQNKTNSDPSPVDPGADDKAKKEAELQSLYNQRLALQHDLNNALAIAAQPTEFRVEYAEKAQMLQVELAKLGIQIAKLEHDLGKTGGVDTPDTPNPVDPGTDDKAKKEAELQSLYNKRLALQYDLNNARAIAAQPTEFSTEYSEKVIKLQIELAVLGVEIAKLEHDLGKTGEVVTLDTPNTVDPGLDDKTVDPNADYKAKMQAELESLEAEKEFCLKQKEILEYSSKLPGGISPSEAAQIVVLDSKIAELSAEIAAVKDKLGLSRDINTDTPTNIPTPRPGSRRGTPRPTPTTDEGRRGDSNISTRRNTLFNRTNTRYE